MAGERLRRIATVDRAVVDRFTMPFPVEMLVRACVDQVSDPQPLAGTIGTSR
jgi:hypothetical protein